MYSRGEIAIAQRFWNTDEDLTSKARIRNAALELFAVRGVSGTSVRAVAEAAGVAPALVIHHFGSKEGLHRTVNELLLDRVSQTLGGISTDKGSARDIAQRRDDRMAEMLAKYPILADYLRRTLTERGDSSNLIFDRLMEFTRAEVRSLRESGVARTDVDETVQSMRVLLQLIGPLLLQPLLEHMERYAASEPGLLDSAQLNVPNVQITIQYRDEAQGRAENGAGAAPWLGDTDSTSSNPNYP